MKPLMLITGPVATRSGYGSHSRDLCRSLIAMDKFDIKINSLRWGNCPMNALNEGDPNDKIILDRLLKTPQLTRQPDLHIHIVIPNEFQPIGRFNIGVTAGIESTTFPMPFIEGFNKMNINLVSSEHSKRVALSCNYEKKDSKNMP